MLNRLYSYFFNKANTVRESFVRVEQETPWKPGISSLLYLFLLELATSFFRFFILLTKTSYESFQVFTNQYTLPVCQYSYFDHKKFQKKVRLFSMAGMSTIIAATIIINLVLSLILPGQLPSYAKTVNSQSGNANLWDDWSTSSTIAGDPPVASTTPTSISASPASSAEVAPESNLVGLWHMDNNWNDSSGNGHTGTPTVATLGASPSKLGGYAGQFSNGATNYVTTSGTLPTLGGVLSVSAWIYPTAYGDVNYNSIVSISNGTCQNQSFLFTVTNSGRLATDGYCGGGAFQSSGATVTLNTWNHVAVVANGTSFTFYLNGQAVQTLTGTALNVQSAPIRLGSTDAPGRGFQGSMDEVAIYSRALSASEITNHYNSGAGKVLGSDVIQLKSTSYTAKDGGTFSSTPGNLAQMPLDGGTGADGSFDPSLGNVTGGCATTKGMTWASPTCTINTNNATYLGTYNFTSIIIPSGIILSATGTNKLIIKATNNVTIVGTLNVNGEAGITGTSTGGAGGTGGAGSGTASTGGTSYGGGGGGGGGGSNAINVNGTATIGSSGGGTSGGGGSVNGGGGGGGNGGNGGGGYGYGGDGGSSYIGEFSGSGGGGGAGNNVNNSGGGGGGGGGYLKIVSSGSISNSGTVNANGGAGGTDLLGSYNRGGGGSGGTIRLMASVSITNSGTINANGGGGNIYGGGGGGGRINLNAPGLASNTTCVAVGGTCYVSGGNGYYLGSVGTIATSAFGFNQGTNASTAVSGTGTGASVGLAIDGGTGANGAYSCASGTCNLAGGTYNYTTFKISTGAIVDVPTGGSQLIIKATGNVTIMGTLNVNGGAGSTNAGGAGGAGGYTGGGCNGAGSGSGGGGANGGITGTTYITELGGSGGGGGSYAGCGGGGGGGGYLKIVSSGSISNTGTINANGGNGGNFSTTYGGGGGSGGTIRVVAVSISNTGIIKAIGGNGGGKAGSASTGNGNGAGNGGNGGVATNNGATAGGGGGGRINLYAPSITSGTLSVAYGTGSGNGTAGPTPGQSATYPAGTYYLSGTFTSASINLGATSAFTNLSFNLNQPTNTDLDVQVAVSSDGTTWSSYYNYDGSTTAVGSAANTAKFSKDNTNCTVTGTNPYAVSCTLPSALTSLINGKQYVKYKAYLSTPDGIATPTLNDITVSYSQYPTTSTISNIKFNTSYSTVKWTGVSFVTNAAVSSTANVKAKIGVASTEGGLPASGNRYGSSNGTTASTATYFDYLGSGQTNCTVANGYKFETATTGKYTYTCAIDQNNATINTSTNQWLELELTLVGDGNGTPQVDAARAAYSVNTNPEVTIAATPAQSTSSANYGNVNFNTSLRDQDTSTGSVMPHSGSTGWVFVALEYSASGSFGTEPATANDTYFSSGTFATAANLVLTRTSANISANCIASNNISALTAQDITILPTNTTAWSYACPVDKNSPTTNTDYSVSWNAKADASGVYASGVSGAKVKMWVTDLEGINPLGFATSSAFVLDTKVPTGSAVASVVPGGTVALTSSDDTVLTYATADSNAGSCSSVTWPSYGSSISAGTNIATSLTSWNFSTNEDTNRRSTACVKLRDLYGNESAVISAVTGPRPQKAGIQDVANVSAGSYKLFVSWEQVANQFQGSNTFSTYNVYRCAANSASDTSNCLTGSYTLIGTPSPTGDSANNSYTNSLTATEACGASSCTAASTFKAYCYRIATNDSAGNISNWITTNANGAQLCGVSDGKATPGTGEPGISDSYPPHASTIEVINLLSTTATIRWTNSEGAFNGIFYGANTGYSDFEKSSVLNYTTSPSFNITGLIPDTTYNAQLKSVDIYGNTVKCDPTSASSSATSSSGTATVVNLATALAGDATTTAYCSGATNLTFRTAFADTAKPIISKNGTTAIVTGITSTSATINWKTKDSATLADETADACVAYDSSSASRNYYSQQCDSTLGITHSVTLSNLVPDTIYYLKLKSTDAAGNAAQDCNVSISNVTAVSTGDCASLVLSDLKFNTGAAADTTAPVISKTPGGGGTPIGIITSVATTTANITWTTDENSDTCIGYDSAASSRTYASEQCKSDSVKNHTITITSLNPNVTYYVKLKSRDTSANQAACSYEDNGSCSGISMTAGNFSFITNPLTAEELNAPVISLKTGGTTVINGSYTTSSTATIEWSTDQSSDSCVGIDVNPAPRIYATEQCDPTVTKNHSVVVSGLSPSTQYYVKVKSRNSNSKLADSCSYDVNTDCPTITKSLFTFTTSEKVEAGGGGAGGKPDFIAPVITRISVPSIGSNSSAVTWTTDESASSFVQYGTSKDNFEKTVGSIDTITSHKVVLENLNSNTTYYYKVVSVDWAGNVGISDTKSFTTASSLAGLSGTVADKAQTQQVLEDLKKQIQSQGAGIVDPLQTLLDSISSLVPEPIIIGESPTIEETSTSAKISWRTDKNSNSFVGLSRADQYDPKADEPYKTVVGNPEDSVKNHEVNIENLLPATKYHFQARSKALLGDMSRSKDFIFTTKSELPEILKYLQKKTDNEKTATVYWSTSVPTDSVVKYTPYVKGVLTPKLSKIEGKPDMVTDHEIVLNDLNPGTLYQIEISGRDPFGNQVSKILPDFTTAIDKEPPVISQVRIESAMTTGKNVKIQTIVSWRTDEPSTGQAFFSEGSAGATEKMKFTSLDKSLTTIHTAVITEFNPASIYRIKLESRDASDNLATSRDFTILTPAQSQSIIDVIVKTFENTFGWAKNIKF